MTIPGFNAEASLYKTSNRYRLAANGSVPTGGNTVVIPQDCGVVKGITCVAGITLGVGLCTGICLEPPPANPLACYICWAAAFPGSLLAFCKDCIPEWMRDLINLFESCGGGGGGDPSCCPPGKTCRCGGRCLSGLCLGGTCLDPGEGCPPIPPPPIGCELGEKCCEHDEQGNCTLCIPRTARCP